MNEKAIKTFLANDSLRMQNRLVESELRNLLNALYEPLQVRADMLYGILRKEKLGYEIRRGFFNGHYRKNERGEYEKDFYPIPEIELLGLCDIEIGFNETCVTAKLDKARLAELGSETFSPYSFEIYGVEDWLLAFGDSDSFATAVQSALESGETEFFFSFSLDGQTDSPSLVELIKLLVQKGFHY